MSDDPALDAITAAIRAATELVTNPPNLVGFDFADLRAAFLRGGPAVFAQGEGEGPDRVAKAVEALKADLKARYGTSPPAPL